MKPTHFKLLMLLLAGLLILFFFGFDIEQYLTINYLKSQHIFYMQYYEQNRAISFGIYFTVIFLLTAFSAPGTTVVVIAGGAVFGFSLTLLVTSFADAFGSTAAFLSSRYFFGKSVQARYSDRLRVINKGIEQEGAFYLFSLRLLPFFPCFLINLLMGVTTIRVTKFYWVTQIGKLPFTVIYALAGTQLGKIDSVLDIFSPGVIISFVMIGLFPLMGKKSIQWARVCKLRQHIHEN